MLHNGVGLKDLFLNPGDQKNKSFKSTNKLSAPYLVKKRLSRVLLSLSLVLLLVGGAAAFYLVKINQDIRQQASSGVYGPSPTSRPVPTSRPAPTSRPVPTPTSGVKKCFLSSSNSYVNPGTTSCGGTKQCVECSNGQWKEVDRSKCSGDPYCGPNIDCTYAKHGEYACLSMNECVRCWDGETQRNQSSSNCSAPCGSKGVVPTPVTRVSKAPTPSPTLKAGVGGACVCEPGETICTLNLLRICNSDCKTWSTQRCSEGFSCSDGKCVKETNISLSTGSCQVEGQACKSDYFEEVTRAGLTIGKVTCYYSTCVGNGADSSCTGSKKCISFSPLDEEEEKEDAEKDTTKSKTKTTAKSSPTPTPVAEEVAKIYLKEGSYCGLFANKECLPGLECKGFPRTCKTPEPETVIAEKTGRPDCVIGEHKCEDGVEYSCQADGSWGSPNSCAYGCGNKACLLPTPTPIPPKEVGGVTCKGQGETVGLLGGSSCCPGLAPKISNFALRCEPVVDLSCREAFVKGCNPDNNGVPQGEQICYYTKKDEKTGLCNLNIKDCGICQDGKVASYRGKSNGDVCNYNYECESGQCIPDVQGHKTCQSVEKIVAECNAGETKCEWWNSSYWQYNCQQGVFVRSNICEGGCSGNQCAANVCTYPSSQCSTDGSKLLVCKQNQTGFIEYACEAGCENGICNDKESCGWFNPCNDNFKCVKGECIPEGVEGNSCRSDSFIESCVITDSNGKTQKGEKFCWYSQLDTKGRCNQNQICENFCSPVGSIAEENRDPVFPTPTKPAPTITPIPTMSALADLIEADNQPTSTPKETILEAAQATPANLAKQDLTAGELTLAQLGEKNLTQEQINQIINNKFGRSYQALVNDDINYLKAQCRIELGDTNNSCNLSSKEILAALYPQIQTEFILEQIEEDKAFSQKLNDKFNQYLAGDIQNLRAECINLTGNQSLCSNDKQILSIVVPGVSIDQVNNIISYKQTEAEKYRQVVAKVEQVQQETINTYLSTDMKVLYEQCKAANPDNYQQCSTQEGILAYLMPSIQDDTINNLAQQKRYVEQENRSLEQLYQDYLSGRNVQDLVNQKCQVVAQSNSQLSQIDCQGDNAGKIIFGLDDAQLALRKENITTRILNRDSEWADEALASSSQLQGIESFSYDLMTTLASSNLLGNSVENYVTVQTDFANQYTAGDKFLASVELGTAITEKVALASAVVAVPALGIAAAAGGASALGVGATMLGASQVSLAGSNVFGAASQTAAVCRDAEDALTNPACLQQGANLALSGANFVLAPVTGSLTAAKQGVALTGVMATGGTGLLGTAQTATSLIASNAQQVGYGLGVGNTILATGNAIQSQDAADWASAGGSLLNTLAGTAGLVTPDNAALNLGTDILADVSGSMIDYYTLQNTANLNPDDQFAQTRALLGLVTGLGQAGFEIRSDVASFKATSGGVDTNTQSVDATRTIADTTLVDTENSNLVKIQQDLAANYRNEISSSDPYYSKIQSYEDLIKSNSTDIDAIVNKLNNEPAMANSEREALLAVRENLIKQNAELDTQKNLAYEVYQQRQTEQATRIAAAASPDIVIANAELELKKAGIQKQVIEQQRLELETSIKQVEDSAQAARNAGKIEEADQILSQKGNLETKLIETEAELAKVNQKVTNQNQLLVEAQGKLAAATGAEAAAETQAEQSIDQAVKLPEMETKVAEEVGSAKEVVQVIDETTTSPETQPNLVQRVAEAVGGWFGRGGQTSPQGQQQEPVKVEGQQQENQQQSVRTQEEIAQELQAGFSQAKQSLEEISQADGDVRKLTERINSLDQAVEILTTRLGSDPDNQNLVSQRTDFEQQRLQLQESLNSAQAKVATLNQDDNFSKTVLSQSDLNTLRPETSAGVAKGQAEELRNQVAIELGKKSAYEIDITKLETDLLKQNDGQRNLDFEQQLNQALRKLKQATLLDAVDSLQQKLVNLDPNSADAQKLIADIDQMLQSREFNIPQVSDDPQKNLQIENIIRAAELRAGQSEGIDFFNTRSNQLSTLAQILASPRVAVELTTAGGKTFVGGLVLEIQKTVYGRDKGVYIAKPGGESDIVNQLKAMSPDGTKVVEFDQNRFLKDKAYQAEVLAADYLVSSPDQIQFLRNTAHNYSLGSTRDVAVDLYKTLTSNVGGYVDELQINMDPSRQAINPVGESSSDIPQNKKSAAQLTGESILETGLIGRWGSGDHEGVLITRELDGAEVARFTNGALDEIFVQLKAKNGETTVFKGMTESEIDSFVDYVRNNAQELEILSSNSNTLAQHLAEDGFKDTVAQTNQVLDQIDLINSFAQGLKMKFGVDYFRDVDTQLQSSNSNKRASDPVTIPAAGGVKNEGQSYTASLQVAMEFIGAKAYAQSNPGSNDVASKVNFEGLTSSPEVAYRSTFADYLADLKNSSIGAVTGAFADGRGVVETTLGFDTYRDTEAVEKIVNTVETNLGARINKERSYMASGLEDSTQLIIDLVQSGKLSQSNGLDSKGSVKYVIGSDDIGDTIQIAQADAKARGFSEEQRYYVQQGGDHYAEIQFIRTVDTDGNEVIVRKVVTDNLDAKGIQKIYQENPENMTIVIGRGGATGDSITTEGNVPGVTLISKDSPEGLVAQAGARIDRGADVADQYAIILDPTRSNLDLNLDPNTRLANANEFDFQDFRQSINEAQLRVEQLKTTQGLDNGIESASTRILAELSMSDNSRVAQWASDKLLEMSVTSLGRNVDLTGGSQDTLAARQAKLAAAQAKWQAIFSDADNQNILKYIEANEPQAFTRMKNNVGVDPTQLAYADQNAPLSKEGVVNSNDLSEYLLQHNTVVKKSDDVDKVAAGNNTSKIIATGAVTSSSISDFVRTTGVEELVNEFKIRQANLPTGSVLDVALYLPRTLRNSVLAIGNNDYLSIDNRIGEWIATAGDTITSWFRSEEAPQLAEQAAEEVPVTEEVSPEIAPVEVETVVEAPMTEPVLEQTAQQVEEINQEQVVAQRAQQNLLQQAESNKQALATFLTNRGYEQESSLLENLAPEQITGLYEKTFLDTEIYEYDQAVNTILTSLGIETEQAQTETVVVEEVSTEETPSETSQEQVTAIELAQGGAIQVVTQEEAAEEEVTAEVSAEESTNVEALPMISTELAVIGEQTRDLVLIDEQTTDLVLPSEQSTAIVLAQDNFQILPYQEVITAIVPVEGYESLPNLTKELQTFIQMQEDLAQYEPISPRVDLATTQQLETTLVGTEELEQEDIVLMNRALSSVAPVEYPALAQPETKEYLPVLYTPQPLAVIVNSFEANFDQDQLLTEYLRSLKDSRLVQVAQTVQEQILPQTQREYPLAVYKAAPLARLSEQLGTEEVVQSPELVEKQPVVMGMTRAIPLMGPVAEVQNLFKQYQDWVAYQETLAQTAEQLNLDFSNVRQDAQDAQVEQAEVLVEETSEPSTAIVLVADQAFPLARVADKDYLEVQLTDNNRVTPLRDTLLPGSLDAIPVGGPIDLVLGLFDQYQNFVNTQTQEQLKFGQLLAALVDQLETAKVGEVTVEEVAPTVQIPEEALTELSLDEQISLLEEQLATSRTKLAELKAQYEPLQAQYNAGLRDLQQDLSKQRIASQFEKRILENLAEINGYLDALNYYREIGDLETAYSVNSRLNSLLQYVFENFGLLAEISPEYSSLVSTYHALMEQSGNFNYSRSVVVLAELTGIINNAFRPSIAKYNEINAAERVPQLETEISQLIDQSGQANSTYSQTHQAEAEKIETLQAEYQTVLEQHQTLVKEYDYVSQLKFAQENDLVQPDTPAELTHDATSAQPETLAENQAYAEVAAEDQQELQAEELRAQLFAILEAIPGAKTLVKLLETLDQTDLLSQLLAMWTDDEISLSEKVTGTFRVLATNKTSLLVNSEVMDIFDQAKSLEDLRTDLTRFGTSYIIMLVDEQTSQISLLNVANLKTAINTTALALEDNESDQEVRNSLAVWPNYAPFRKNATELIELAINERTAQQEKENEIKANYRQEQARRIENLTISSSTTVKELKDFVANPANSLLGWLSDDNQYLSQYQLLNTLDAINFDDPSKVITEQEIPISTLREKIQAFIDLRKSEASRKASEAYQKAETAFAEFTQRLGVHTQVSVRALNNLTSNDLDLGVYLRLLGLEVGSNSRDLNRSKQNYLNQTHPDNYQLLSSAYASNPQQAQQAKELLEKLGAATQLLNRATEEVSAYLSNPQQYLATRPQYVNQATGVSPSTYGDFLMQKVASATNWAELYQVLASIYPAEQYSNIQQVIENYKANGFNYLDQIPVEYGVRAKVIFLYRAEATNRAYENKISQAENLLQLTNIVKEIPSMGPKVAQDIDRFVEGEIFSSLLPEDYGIRNKAEQLLESQKVAYLRVLENIPALQGVLPSFRHFSTSLASLARIWAILRNQSFDNLQVKSLADINRNTFSQLVVEIEQILLSGDIYKRYGNSLAANIDIPELIANLKAVEYSGAFFDADEFYSPAEVQAVIQAVETFKEAELRQDYSTMESSLNQIVIPSVKMNLYHRVSNIYNERLNRLSGQALQAKNLAELKEVFSQAEILYQPSTLVAHAIVLTPNYLTESLDKVVAGEMAVESFPIERLRRKVSEVVEQTRAKDLTFQKVSFNEIRQKYNSIRQAFNANNLRDSKLLGFWRSIVRDFEGRWEAYSSSSYFKGRQSTPTSGAKDYIWASLESKELFLEGLSAGKYRQSYEEYKQWIIEMHKKAAYKGEPGVLQSQTSNYRSSGHVGMIIGRGDAESILSLARKYNDPYINLGLQYLELPGIPDKYAPSDLWFRSDSVVHEYPGAEAIDSYFSMAQQSLIKAVETPQGDDTQFLANLAAFYQYSLNSRAFKKVNNSLFVNLMNTLLEMRGLNPIEQGILDFAAMRLQPQTFANYLIDEVRRVNPNLNAHHLSSNLEASLKNKPVDMEVELIIGSKVKGKQTINLRDNLVSANHARIFRNLQGEWNIQDLNSTNGTFVNGRKIYGVTYVEDGSTIQIGKNSYRLTINGDKVDLKKLKETSFSSSGSYKPNGCSVCSLVFDEAIPLLYEFYTDEQILGQLRDSFNPQDQARALSLENFMASLVEEAKNLANDHTFKNEVAQETLDALAETADARLKQTQAEKAQALAEMDEALSTIDQAIFQSSDQRVINDLNTLRQELSETLAELETLEVEQSNFVVGVIERIKIQLEEIGLYVKRISGDVRRVVRAEEGEEEVAVTTNKISEATTIREITTEMESQFTEITNKLPEDVKLTVVETLASKKTLIQDLYDAYPDDADLFYALHGFAAPPETYTIVRHGLAPTIIYSDSRLRTLIHSNDWRSIAEDFVFEGQVSDYQEFDEDLLGSVYRSIDGNFSIFETDFIDESSVKHEFQHIFNAFILPQIYRIEIDYERIFDQKTALDQLPEEFKQALEAQALAEVKRRDADELLARVMGGDSTADLEDYIRADAWAYDFSGSATFNISYLLNLQLSELRSKGLEVSKSVYDDAKTFFQELEDSLNNQRRDYFKDSAVVIILLKEDGYSDSEILSLLMNKNISSWKDLVPADRLESYQLDKVEAEINSSEKIERENLSSEAALSQANQVLDELLNLDFTTLINEEDFKTRREFSILVFNHLNNDFSICEINANTPTTTKVFLFRDELRQRLYDLSTNSFKGVLTEEKIQEFLAWLNEQKLFFQQG